MQNHPFFDRRTFLTHLTVLGVAGLIRGSDLDRAPIPSRVALDELTAGDFSCHVGSTFRLLGDHGSFFDAELIQVRPGRSSRNSPVQSRQPFALLFRLGATERLPHRIYRVEHAALGKFDLFLGAVGRCSTEVRLEAVFS